MTVCVCCFVAGNDFPGSFESTAKKIHRLLLHVLSHIYESHYDAIVLLRLHAHLNTLLQHFMLFNLTHLLLEEKETEALDELFHKLLGSDRGTEGEEERGQGDEGVDDGVNDNCQTQTDSPQTNSQPLDK